MLLVSFGGPESPDEVLPFLQRVTASRGVPVERLAEVAEQYHQMGGVSPINEQCRRLRARLADHLDAAGHPVPVWWGNLNWNPFLADVVAEMAAAGHRRVLAVTTSAYSSNAGCRRYLDEIDRALASVGSRAPTIHKVRAYFDHPGFVLPFAEAAATARERLPETSRGDAHLVATAHSIPSVMADVCDYETQIRETARLVADTAGFARHSVAWQSRSGPPTVPWLEPDVNDHLRALAENPLGDSAPPDAVVLAPVGFVSDHMEVLWDLDTQAGSTAADLGLSMVRAVAPGTEPDERFVAMLAELVVERLVPGTPRRALGTLGVRPDFCPPGCCPAGRAGPPQRPKHGTGEADANA